MKIIFALLLIIFLSFSGYHLSFRKVKLNLPLFARRFYLTGTEFLFLGLLLGPQFLNLLDADTQKGLTPLVALVLGWIGMLYGFQFEITKLRKFPIEFLTAAHVESFLTLGIVLLIMGIVLPMFFQIAAPMKLPLLLLLASTSACSAQTGLALMTPNAVSRRKKTLHILRYISGIDGVCALFVFSLIFVFFHPSAFSGLEGTGQKFVFSLGTSVGLLFLFILFLRKRLPENELILVVIGMVIFASGIALVLNFSALLINFFVGFCLVNLSPDKERIYGILMTVEKPAYLLVLVFLGTDWNIYMPWIYVFAIIFWISRLAGKIFSGVLIARVIIKSAGYPAYMGFGLLEQGGLPLAMLLDFRGSFPDAMTAQVISMVLIAVILNDLLSPQFLRKLLQENKNGIIHL